MQKSQGTGRVEKVAENVAKMADDGISLSLFSP